MELTRLKKLIFEHELRQRQIVNHANEWANRLCICSSRLSRVIHGKIRATPLQKAAISAALRKLGVDAYEIQQVEELRP